METLYSIGATPNGLFDAVVQRVVSISGNVATKSRPFEPVGTVPGVSSVVSQHEILLPTKLFLGL